MNFGQQPIFQNFVYSLGYVSTNILQERLYAISIQQKKNVKQRWMDKATGHKNIKDYVNIQLGGRQPPCIQVSILLPYLILARFVYFIRKK